LLSIITEFKSIVVDLNDSSSIAASYMRLDVHIFNLFWNSPLVTWEHLKLERMEKLNFQDLKRN
jgi:hypothetical protein